MSAQTPNKPDYLQHHPDAVNVDKARFVASVMKPYMDEMLVERNNADHGLSGAVEHLQKEGSLGKPGMTLQRMDAHITALEDTEKLRQRADTAGDVAAQSYDRSSSS